MAPAGEADNAHAGGNGALNTGRRVLDHDGVGNREIQRFSRMQENIRGRLAAPLPDLVRSKDVGPETVIETGPFQRDLQPRA